MKIELYTPTPYQKELIDYVCDNPKGKRVTVKAPRQCGKSYTVVNLLAYFALTNNNTESILFQPSHRQCANMINTFQRNLGKVLTANKSDMTIEFPYTHSTVRFLSSEQAEETLRGYTCTVLLIYDEASSIKENCFAVTKPYANVHNPTILYISSPKFRTGTFYDYCTSDTAKHFEWHITDNPFITEEQLNDIRRTTPPNIYKAEYLGEWLETSSDLFGEFNDIVRNTFATTDNNVGGLDWGTGTGNDYTAIVAFNANQEMCGLDYFNDEDPNKTIERIVKFINKNKIKKLVVESNGIGQVFLNILKKSITSCQIVPFTTTNDTKRKAIETLQVKVMNKEITLLNDQELLLEFASYEMQKTPQGKITYNGQNGIHDDIVMATAFALYGQTKGKYTISVL